MPVPSEITGSRAGVRGHLPLVLGRVGLTVAPAFVAYLFGLIPFWGGLLFFVVADVIRWLWTLFYRAPAWLRPVRELLGVLGAPLFSLSILLLFSLPLLDKEVQMDLVGAFFLYVLYIPYAVATLFILPALEQR